MLVSELGAVQTFSSDDLRLLREWIVLLRRVRSSTFFALQQVQIGQIPAFEHFVRNSLDMVIDWTQAQSHTGAEWKALLSDVETRYWPGLASTTPQYYACQGSQDRYRCS